MTASPSVRAVVAGAGSSCGLGGHWLPDSYPAPGRLLLGAHVMRSHGQLCVCVSNPSVPQLPETIYAACAPDGRWSFWWSWGDRIAPVTEVETAAFKIAYVLVPSASVGA